jgi:hypothetical protein
MYLVATKWRKDGLELLQKPVLVMIIVSIFLDSLDSFANSILCTENKSTVPSLESIPLLSRRN